MRRSTPSLTGVKIRLENGRLLRQPPAFVLQVRKRIHQVGRVRQVARRDGVLEAIHNLNESFRVQRLHPLAVREIDHVPGAIDGYDAQLAESFIGFEGLYIFLSEKRIDKGTFGKYSSPVVFSL